MFGRISSSISVCNASRKQPGPPRFWPRFLGLPHRGASAGGIPRRCPARVAFGAVSRSVRVRRSDTNLLFGSPPHPKATCPKQSQKSIRQERTDRRRRKSKARRPLHYPKPQFGFEPAYLESESSKGSWCEAGLALLTRVNEVDLSYRPKLVVCFIQWCHGGS